MIAIGIALEIQIYLFFQGNHEDVCSLYEQAIAIEKAKEHSQTLPLLFAQYARFVFLVILLILVHRNQL